MQLQVHITILNHVIVKFENNEKKLNYDTNHTNYPPILMN